MRRTLRAGGNALLVTMIALAVLMVLVVGALRFTGTNREAAAAKMKGDASQACADAARRYLMAKFRTFGVPIEGLTLDNTIPDSPIVANRTRILTAHYDSLTSEPTIVAVSAQSMGQSRRQVRDMSNVPAGTTLGGRYYRVVVKCRDAVSRRESELEFTFRHGI